MTGTIAGMQQIAAVIDHSNIGYDQSQRWSFLNGDKIVPGTEADCSSTCGAIAKLAGYPVDLSDPFFTGDFKDRLVAAGFSAIKFTSLSQVRPGDFILNEADHVEFAYTSTNWFTAHEDEHGRGSGGQAGNQTGHETGFGPPYIFPTGGWDYILRPPTGSTSAPAPTPAPMIKELEMECIAVSSGTIKGEWYIKGSKKVNVSPAQLAALTALGVEKKTVTDAELNAFATVSWGNI